MRKVPDVRRNSRTALIFDPGLGRFGRRSAFRAGQKKVHLHKFFVRFEHRTAESKDVEKSVVDLWGDILKVLQHHDPELALVKGHDDDIMATSRQQLPTDLQDLKEERLVYECANKSF